MRPLTYTRVTNVPDALAAVAANPNARFLAGGTNLVDFLRVGVETPDHLVDINALPLDKVETYTGGVRIGALARMSDVAANATVRDRYPVLAQALELGASAQLRNMASIGGNLLQHPRCPYYRETEFACNRRSPGSGCAALGATAENRSHAILGGSDQCIAVYPSDMAVALLALDAVVVVANTAGERRIPFGDFHRLPGNTPQVETALRPGELIAAVELPDMPAARRSVYLKVRDRASYAFALASAAVVLDVTGGTVRDARVALGGVATKPWRVQAVENALLGKPANADTFAAAAASAADGAQPRPTNAFKVPLIGRTVERALQGAMAMGGAA